MPTRALKDPLIVEAQAYLSKLRQPFSAQTLFINPKKAISEDRAAERIRRESAELLVKTTGYYRIALSEQGISYSSSAWSAYLTKLCHNQAKLAFVIGGAFGLDPELIKQCDAKMSLSSMTLPHRMALLILAEQIYRASEIANNTAYHK